MSTWRLLAVVPALLSLIAACDKAPAADQSEEPVMAVAKDQETATEQATVSAQDLTAELAVRLSQIKAMIGAAAADHSAQCKIIGVGQKPCGGPAFYLPYSTKDVDEAKLLSQIDAYNQLAKAHNERSGMMSDCAIVPVPQVALVGGFCKIGAAADAL